MNCRQFEKRIQQLLDDRVDPQMDLTLQRHAQICGGCRLALSIYACFEQTPLRTQRTQYQALHANPGVSQSGFHGAESTVMTSVGPVASGPLASPTVDSGRSRRFQGLRRLLATAALVALCLLSAWRTTPDSRPSPSALVASLPQPMAPENAVVVSDLGAGLANWLPRSWSMSMSDVNFYSMAQNDLIYLVPERHLQTVRGLPATIESIEPIYRYSAEFPVISQWSNGIHYTLGLIRNHLPVVSSGRPVPKRDLGSQFDFRKRYLC